MQDICQIGKAEVMHHKAPVLAMNLSPTSPFGQAIGQLPVNISLDQGGNLGMPVKGRNGERWFDHSCANPNGRGRGPS